MRITDTATVRATHSDGTDLVVDDDTLRFRSEPGYFGPASLSFTVTDGESAADPAGADRHDRHPDRRASPPRTSRPPFTGGVIDFEPGQAKTIDLVKLTNYPYPDAVDELDFRVLPPTPDGFDVSLDGQRAHDRGGRVAPRTGARQAVTIAVADAAGDGRPGRIELRVVPSTRPLAQPAADVAVAARGRTTTIDVLANDEATNPFPGDPAARRRRCAGSTDSLPDGVSDRAERRPLHADGRRRDPAPRRSTPRCSTRWPTRPTIPAGTRGAR